MLEVFNLEVEGNENCYVTEDGILVHNGYGSNDGGKLEEDIKEALDEAKILNTAGEKFGANGSIGEIDFQTPDYIIEATVKNKGKLKQINKLLTDSIMNPDGKPVILIAPNYTNSSAVKAIEDAGATVVHTIEDLISILNK
ncbi:MAG: hypothetical protein RL662_754 [Bacteroidota bacterium]